MGLVAGLNVLILGSALILVGIPPVEETANRRRAADRTWQRLSVQGALLVALLGLVLLVAGIHVLPALVCAAAAFGMFELYMSKVNSFRRRCVIGLGFIEAAIGISLIVLTW